jgi:hypothetical protein
MAGRGSRFQSVHDTKVLYPVPPDGEPMFAHAVRTLGFAFDRLVLVCLRMHNVPPLVREHLADLPSVTCVELDAVTGGPMESVLKARSLIARDPEGEVVICNADQAMVWPGDWAMKWFVSRGALGGIPTLRRESLRHSYVGLDPEVPHKVVGVREKVRISDRASIGVYWFRRADAFLAAADRMMAANDRAPNGEFYVGPCYNYLDGPVFEYPLCEFWSLGEPENLEAYLARDYLVASHD